MLSTGRKPSQKVSRLPSRTEGGRPTENVVNAIVRDDEEEELSKFVFGEAADFASQLVKPANETIGDHSDVDSDIEVDADEGRASEEALNELDDDAIFFIDTRPSGTAIDKHSTQVSREEDHSAWEDSDDDRLAVSLAGNTRLRKLRLAESEDIVSGRDYAIRLRRQFERLHPVPDWAVQSARPAKRRRRSSAVSESSISSNEMEVDLDDISTLPLARILQDAGSFAVEPKVSTKRSKLRPEVIDIQRSRDIPTTMSSPITSLSFHSKHPVLLSSGLSSILYLHHIDPTAHPTPNPMLTSVQIKYNSITTASFLPPLGDKIFFSGRRRYFHTWDLSSGLVQKVSRIYGHQDDQKSMERFSLSPCGRYMALIGTARKNGGIINILNASTTQWIASARIEGRQGVADLAWWRNGEGLTVVSKSGEVGEYCMRTQSFVARWTDNGSIGATVLTLGGLHGPAILGGDRWVVIGSESGVVNIYDRRPLASGSEVKVPARPVPTKSFMQLNTAISNLTISPDGQVLVMSSRAKKDALRLIHLPSCTVYRNWPTSSTPLGRVTAVAWDMGSNMLAVGNDVGRVRLWEIRR